MFWAECWKRLGTRDIYNSKNISFVTLDFHYNHLAVSWNLEVGKVMSGQLVKYKYCVISYLTSVSDYIVYIVISFLRNFKLVWVWSEPLTIDVTWDIYLDTRLACIPISVSKSVTVWKKSKTSQLLINLSVTVAYSGIGSRLGRNRLWVRFLAVSDIYPIFIEPTITWVPLGYSGYIWIDSNIVFEKSFRNYGGYNLYVSQYLNNLTNMILFC